MPTISFLSDYGYKDEFVGVVKSVIGSIAGDIQVLDITHSIARHDVRAGSLTLARSSQYLQPGVVLAVVDPKVGSERRAVAVELAEQNSDGSHSYLVGPDNGLLAPAVAMLGGASRAVRLTNQKYQLPRVGGTTFDGRDIFGPAAAHLAKGVLLEELGEEVSVASLMPGVVPAAQIHPDHVVAEVLWVDHFGNAQLNVGPDDIFELGERFSMRILGLPEPGEAALGLGLVGESTRVANSQDSGQPVSFKGKSRIASRANTYDQIAPKEVGLVVDSYGMVSVAMRQRSASEELTLEEGMSVVLNPFQSDLVELKPRRAAGQS